MRHQPRQRAQVLRRRRDDEAGVGEVYALAADGGWDVAHALAHPVALVARPVRQRDVHHAAGA